MDGYALEAIRSVMSGKRAFCKFLSANDTGLTGGHQAGIYISKPSIPILFSEAGQKGQNKERWAKVHWQNDFETDTRFIYYGQGSRNEYRITNFGRGFPYLRPEYTGALFVFVQIDEDDYQGYVLETDDEIEQFLNAFGMSPAETNRLIDVTQVLSDIKEKAEFDLYIESLNTEFPSSEEMSSTARKIEDKISGHQNYVITNPDVKLIDWTDMEYRLFRAIEYAHYKDLISCGFPSVDDFISTANAVLNRRKSRAGKSLEHHLEAIFTGNMIRYNAQAVTEGNKRPDFLFPSQEAYHDSSYPVEKIVSLAAKTTCKDRWRQIINEADRLRDKPKFLCTLQQGISPAQMDEMQTENVVLVVPSPYISTYPKDRQDRIWSLAKFVNYIKEIEG